MTIIQHPETAKLINLDELFMCHQMYEHSLIQNCDLLMPCYRSAFCSYPHLLSFSGFFSLLQLLKYHCDIYIQRLNIFALFSYYVPNTDKLFILYIGYLINTSSVSYFKSHKISYIVFN